MIREFSDDPALLGFISQSMQAEDHNLHVHRPAVKAGKAKFAFNLRKRLPMKPMQKKPHIDYHR